MSRLAEVAMDLFVELFGSMLAFVYRAGFGNLNSGISGVSA
jgi:hypothetical protein